MIQLVESLRNSLIQVALTSLVNHLAIPTSYCLQEVDIGERKEILHRWLIDSMFILSLRQCQEVGHLLELLFVRSSFLFDQVIVRV